jgi:predicted amidohydrolase
VFDEDRYFEPADAPLVITHAGRRIGVTICEDIWTNPALGSRRLHRINPVALLAAQGVDLMVNLSASPWHHGKGALREQLVIDAALQLRAPVIYCNAVGGNDELVFDGRSLVASPDGAEGSVTLHADARLFAGLFDGTQTAELALEPARKAYVQVLRGQLQVNGTPLATGDAALLSHESHLRLSHGQDAEVLVFDLSA